MKLLIRLICVLGLVCITVMSSSAQKKVTLKQADKLLGGVSKGGTRFDRFIGDVIFEQNETTIYSDSAHFYRKENHVEAFGDVKITEGDSVVITANKLIYDGDNKLAKLRGDVVFVKKGQVTLYTDFLNYDRMKQQAMYFNGGKVVDSINVLTSKKGYYQVDNNMASFKSNVVGKNPDYTLKSDTLQYNTRTKVVYFRDQTELTDSEGSVFNYKEGQYDTRVKSSDLNLGEMETESYILSGDNLSLDDMRKYYTATGNVEMISKEQDVIITGDHGFYQKKEGIAKVYGRALMKKVMQNDTMFLTADTLVAIESEIPSKKRLLAYHNVKIFKTDLQGIADSLAYFTADSIIHFYNDPVLWSEGNQMTADSINVQIANGVIDKLNMTQNSFVISQDSIKNFNQVKGRRMLASFKKGNINKVDVTGNGESLFFALDDADSVLVGMNKIICSYITINFKDNKADNLSFYVKPDASFIPPHELKAEQKQLKGFRWRAEEKPKKQVMLKNTILNEEQPADPPGITPLGEN